MSERIIQRTPNLGIAIRMQPLTLEAVIEPIAPCVPSITGPFWYNPETNDYDLSAVTGIVKIVNLSCTPTSSHFELWYGSNGGTTWQKIEGDENGNITLTNSQLQSATSYSSIYVAAFDGDNIKIDGRLIDSIVTETTGDREFYGYALGEYVFNKTEFS